MLGPLTIVQLEPQRVPLLLEGEITPGCIQHIISNLVKYGKDSKEICDKMCRILCRVHMYDDSSRKSQPNLTLLNDNSHS